MISLPTTQTGFTIIELLASIAILGLLGVVVWNAFPSFTNTTLVDSAARNIESLVEDARTRTLASEQDKQYGVRFTSTGATLFAGNTYTAGAESNKEYTFPTKLSLSNALTGGTNTILFERLTGDASATGTVTISLSGSSETRVLTIVSSGLVEITQ